MNLPPIHINEFDYPLKAEQIAQYPLEKRSASKLLVYKDGKIDHRKFSELPSLLPSNTLLVFNNTKVIHARLHFRKESGAEIEVFLLNPVNHENAGEVLARKESTVWQCLVGNKKRFKDTDILQKDDLSALWLDRENDVIQFKYGDKCFADVIEEHGNLPIPPYLNRPTENIDITRYQTTFAINDGSVAAPTAALHFDEDVQKELNKMGIKQNFLTLHVGAGTFKPVSTSNALDHEMHREYIAFSRDFIEDLLNHNGPVIPVGTTSLRSLESLFWFGVGLKNKTLDKFYIEQYFPYQNKTSASKEECLSAVLKWMDQNQLKKIEGTSSIYIVPGYQSKMVNGIITNFHQPQSTLLLLVSALIGDDWKRVYQTALENNYRFLSYGDSSLLLF